MTARLWWISWPACVPLQKQRFLGELGLLVFRWVRVKLKGKWSLGHPVRGWRSLRQWFILIGGPTDHRLNLCLDYQACWERPVVIASICSCHLDLPGRQNGPSLGESVDDHHVHFLTFGDFPGNQNFEMADGWVSSSNKINKEAKQRELFIYSLTAVFWKPDRFRKSIYLLFFWEFSSAGGSKQSWLF